MVRSRVDLPAPLAPMMACVSPSSMREVDVEQGLEMAVARWRCRRARAGSCRHAPHVDVAHLGAVDDRLGIALRDQLPKSMAMSRSTTASSAWTMCSIQMMLMPSRAQPLDGLDERLHLLLGEAAGDLVEEQDLGLGGQSPGQFEALALEQAQRLGQDVGAGQQDGAVQRPRADLVGGLLRRGLCRRCRRPARSRRPSCPRTAWGSGRCAPSPRWQRSVGRAAGRCPAPAKMTVPASGWTMPVSRLSMVVLPAPLGPTTPSASPSMRETLRSSTTLTPP